jgi:hypothetical protein
MFLKQSIVLALLFVVVSCGSRQSETATTTVVRTETVTVTEEATGSTGTTTNASENAGQAANLVVTPAVRHRIRASRIEFLSPKKASQIEGPLPGSIYYGKARGEEWAIAEFQTPSGHETEFFTTTGAAGHLSWVSDIGGVQPTISFIPCSLRRAWGFGCG